MGGLINAIDISAQGLSAQRAKMDVIAENMANAETVETPDGGPYQRKRVMIAADKKQSPFTDYLSQARTRLAQTHEGHRPSRIKLQAGTMDVATVKHRQIEDPESNFRLVHDPTHPYADDDGFVKILLASVVVMD